MSHAVRQAVPGPQQSAHAHMPTRSVLVQRCACGATTGPMGTCAECHRKKRLQPKLTVNQPGGHYEQEADRVAHQVMQSTTAEKPSTAPLRIHRVESNDAPTGYARTDAPPIVQDTLRSPGQPLDAATRTFMETRFGHDFSRVRIHTDAQAAASAQAVQARAYTVGHDVTFGTGEYAPGTPSGRRLLAHELTHVIQQGAGWAAVQRQSVDYDTDQIATSPPTQSLTLKQAQDLIDAEKKAKTLTSATVTGNPAPAGTDAEIFLLHLIAQLAAPDRWGSEADLIVQIGWPPAQGKPAPTGLVTVTFDAQGNATAELLATGTVATPTTHTKKTDAITALKTTYGIKDVQDGDATWDVAELNKVLGAFALLPSSDQAALKGVVLERVQTLPNSRAGEFDYKQEVAQGATSATNTATLRLANLAFSGDAVGFVGGAKNAQPASYQVIVHEVGHAVATQKVREKVGVLHEAMVEQNKAAADLNPLVEPLNEAADKLNALVEAYNAGDAAKKAELKPKVDAARKDYDAKKKAYDSKKKAADAAEKKVEAAKTPAAEAKDSSTLLASLDTTIAARKKAAATAQQTAEKAATAYKDPVAKESESYRNAVAEAATKIEDYATALATANTPATDVAQAETDALQAVGQRDTKRGTLESTNKSNAALTDFAPVDAAQDAWLEAVRLRAHVAGKGKALQSFVDFVTREKIAPFTEYAQDEWPHNPDEFFAEAYSLWLTDPDYLKTNAKKLYDWFAAGSHRL